MGGCSGVLPPVRRLTLVDMPEDMSDPNLPNPYLVIGVLLLVGALDGLLLWASLVGF